MIAEFLNSTIIVDDTPGDVTNLKKILSLNDINYKFYTPEKLIRSNRKWKNKKIIFLDLYLTEDNNVSSQISYAISNIFRKKIDKDFGVYGIVLWSRHTNEKEDGNEKSDLEIYKEKIAKASLHYSFTPPLFIIGLDKSKYIRDNSFKQIFVDLEKELKNTTAANFFIKWSHIIEKGKEKVVNDIFSLVKNYEFQDDNLKFLLFHLAKNQTGIHHENLDEYPLYSDAYRAFSDLLIYDISSQLTELQCGLFEELEDIRFHHTVDNEVKLSFDYERKYYKNDQPNLPKAERYPIDQEVKTNFAKLNTKILIDEYVNHQKVLPGNIYRVKDESSIYISEKIRDNDIPIVIEMTPPCDFANGKKAHPKILGGFISKFDDDRMKSLKGEAFYTEPHPLFLNNYEDNQMITFDFRYTGIITENNLLDGSKYELLYRAKDSLFADILQKMSSHIARLGLAVLH